MPTRPAGSPPSRSAATRSDARTIFTHALEDCSVHNAVRRDLQRTGSKLRIGDISVDLAQHPQAVVIAIGKAGATLYEAVAPFLAGIPSRAIVSAPAPPAACPPGTQFFPGGHPEPNEASLAAAEAALQLLATAQPQALVLFLVSGGASSMFELPLCDSVPLADLRACNRLLVASGASIAQINCVRKHLSRVKGGRLALAAAPRTTVTLLVSDVPPHSLDALGSGPSLPDASTLIDFHQILRQFNLADTLPPSVRACISSGLAETPKAEHPAFHDDRVHVLLDNGSLLAAAARAATALGYTPTLDTSTDDWPLSDAADLLLRRAADLRAIHRRGCLIAGGEISVPLPANVGTGGRNQQFALHCALTPHLAAGLCVLSAGSDGVDGNSPAAGAVVDASTAARAHAAALDLPGALARFDAFPVLHALGDTILTGPTGNNLRDLRLLLWDLT